MQTVMIDFDGVIHKYSRGWQKGILYDGPVEGAKEALRLLKEELNYKIVIFTARLIKDVENLQRAAVEAWLKQYEIPYDAITCEKLPAIIYIDDRGFRFEGTWIENLPLIVRISEGSRKSSFVKK
jgi:hypothetical protein